MLFVNENIPEETVSYRVRAIRDMQSGEFHGRFSGIERYLENEEFV